MFLAERARGATPRAAWLPRLSPRLDLREPDALPRLARRADHAQLQLAHQRRLRQHHPRLERERPLDLDHQRLLLAVQAQLDALERPAFRAQDLARRRRTEQE